MLGFLFWCLGLLIINELSATGFDPEENIAYEFVTQAMTIYEEEISDSKHKIQVLPFAQTLYRTVHSTSILVQYCSATFR